MVGESRDLRVAAFVLGESILGGGVGVLLSHSCAMKLRKNGALGFCFCLLLGWWGEGVAIPPLCGEAAQNGAPVGFWFW